MSTYHNQLFPTLREREETKINPSSLNFSHLVEGRHSAMSHCRQAQCKDGGHFFT